jgi:hypothetical protein
MTRRLMGHMHSSIQSALASEPTGSQSIQSALASETTGTRWSATVPHHPITCRGPLWFYDDGRFACEHVTVPPDDPRTRAALDQTVAVLLLELAAREA